MSRLRRLVLSDRFFFLSCRVLPNQAHVSEHEFGILARVIRERREEHGFLLTAWVLLPDHWHDIIYRTIGSGRACTTTRERCKLRRGRGVRSRWIGLTYPPTLAPEYEEPRGVDPVRARKAEGPQSL